MKKIILSLLVLGTTMVLPFVIRQKKPRNQLQTKRLKLKEAVAESAAEVKSATEGRLKS